MNSRRRFISKIAQASALGLLPVHMRYSFATAQTSNDSIIDAVEILKLTGSYKRRPGFNRRHQVKAIDVYDDQGPAAYTDNSSSRETTSSLTQYYLSIRTKGGLSRIYGLIDSGTVSPILKQLRPFLMGKDALAIEKQEILVS